MKIASFVRDAVLASLQIDQKLANNSNLKEENLSEGANPEHATDATDNSGVLNDSSTNENKYRLDGKKRVRAEMTSSEKGNESRVKLDEVAADTRKSKRRKAGAIADINWKALQKQLVVRKKPRLNDGQTRTAGDSLKFVKKNVKHVKEGISNMLKEDAGDKSRGSSFSAFMTRAVRHDAEHTPIVAMDCEMVGTGPDGRHDVLGRVSVVNYLGDVLYDTFVKPGEEVTDYRTQWSGIRPSDIGPESTAVTAVEAQQVVGELLKGRIVVGHALKNDFRVLQIAHPWHLVRDTSNYYKKLWRRGGKARPALRNIVAEVIGVDGFQKGEHDSCEDARAALAVYKKNAKEWERSIRRGSAREGKSTSNKTS